MKNSSLYSLLGTVFFALGNVLFYAFLIRQIEAEQMRQWVLFLVLVSFVEMARQGMVNNGMQRLLAAPNAEKSAILGAGLFLSMLSAVLGTSIAFVLSFPLSTLWNMPILPNLCLHYFGLSFIWSMYKWAETSLAARERFDGVFYAVLAYSTVLLASFFIISRNGALNLTNLIGIQSLASCAAVCLILSQKKWRNPVSKPTKKNLKALFDFGRYSMGTNFLSMLFNKMDVLLLGALLPGASVVLYDAATRVFAWLDLPLNALAAVLYPRLCKAFGSENMENMRLVYEKGLIHLLLITLPAVIFVLVGAPLILEVLAGKDYVAAAPVLRILVLATLVKPWGRLAGMALDASGHPQANFYLLVFSASSNFILNLILIKSVGLVGAAIATSVSIWCTVLIGQVWVQRYLPVNQLDILKKIPTVAQDFRRNPFKATN